MNQLDFQRILARRQFLDNCSGGLGAVALAHLLGVEGRTAAASGP